MDILEELLNENQPKAKQDNSSSLLSQVSHYRLILQQGWWIIALTLSVALAIGAWFIFQKPPKYRSYGRMMVSGKIALPEGGAMYSEESSNFFGTQLGLMQSDTVSRRAQARVQALHPDIKPVLVKLDVAQERGASIFTLTTTSDEPQYSQAYLEAVMNEYIEMKKEMRSHKSEVTLTAITDELKSLDKTLQQYESELHTFEKENNIGYIQQGGNSAGVYLVGLEQKLASLKTEYELLNRLDLDQNLRRQNSPAAKDATGSAPSQEPIMQTFGPQSDYMKVNQQVQLLKAKLEDFSQYLRPKHPIIVALNNEISLQEKLLNIFRNQSKTQLAAQKDSVSIQIGNIESQIDEWRTKALDLSERMGEYDKLKGRLDRARSMYDRLLTSMQAVDVNKNIDQDIVSILERASTAYPVKLGIPQTLGIAITLGLMLGVGAVLLRDRLDDKLKSVNVFQTHFVERIMGQIAYEQASGDLELLKPDDSRHLFAEAFSNIRSALFFAPQGGKRPKTLLVTSAAPNEGKSTVTANLAITLAAGGSKTLLVDCDLRRGQQKDTFDVQLRAGGFAEVLTQEIPADHAIVPTDFANLYLLPRGRVLNQPSRYLLGPTMDQFLASVSHQYDYIIFDSCPILAADDTTSFAPKIDATLFVMRVGQSSIRSGRKALEFLYSRRAHVLGVILNAVDSSTAEYNYYQYYDYYHNTNVAEAS